MSTHVRKTKGLWPYFVLAYALMLLTWGLMALFQLPGASSVSNAPAPTPGTLLLFFLGGFTPSIAGIVMTWRVAGGNGVRDLWKRATLFNLGWSWYGAMLGVPLLILLARIMVHLARGGTLMESHLLAQPLSLIAFTISIIVLGPLAEEFGWRGFALEQLLVKWHVLRASLLLGILWAFWHLPLFFIPGTAQQLQGSPLIAFPVFALAIIAEAVVISWVYINTGRSLFAAMFFHFTINWFGSFAPTIIDGGLVDRIVQMVAYVSVAAVIAWWWRPPYRSAPRLLKRTKAT